MTRRLMRPRRWTPPTAPPNGGRTATTARLAVERTLDAGGHGPEDVAFDDRGRILAGLEDGRVIAVDPETGDLTTVASTSGRPLGLDPRPDGTALVADHDRGLLHLDADGGVTVLVDRVDGQPLTFASNVAQAPDGTIWFTSSTSRWELSTYRGDMLEHSGTGRLLRRDPDGTVTTVLDGLDFANGVVLAPDGSHVLVAESSGYRILRHWITGPRLGETEPFAENLPGFPDNMSLGSDGNLWVAMAAPRNSMLDRLLPLPGLLRLIVWNMPDALQPQPAPIAWVMAFDLTGALVHDLRDEDGAYGFVTSVAERDGVLALGSLHEDRIAIARP